MMTIRQTLEFFLKDRSLYCSAATLKKYHEDVGYFFRFLEDDLQVSLGREFPEEPDLFREFVVFLRSRNIRTASILSYCRSVKAYLRYCHENDYCKDYLRGVKLPRDDSAPKMPLYADEVALIDAQFDKMTEYGLRNYCIVHLMLDCGLRRQEVLHLQTMHLDRPHNIIHIMDSKGSKSRMALVPGFLLDALSDYLQMSGHASGMVFPGLTENAVKMLFQHLKEKTGINRLHAHLLRHTFATSYLLGGGNMEFLRVFMGHSDYAVTQGYSSLAAECKMLGADIYRLDPIFFTRGY